ncbi:MAG: acyloxyacyl hydrolase [Phycisphaeraceae bacterium]
MGHHLAFIALLTMLGAAAPIDAADPFDHSLAQNTSTEPAPPIDQRAADERPRHPFTKESWTFQLYGSGVTMDEDHGYISTAHLGFGYHLEDHFSINLEGIGGWVDSKTDDDGGVGGFDLLLRDHLFHDDDHNWTLYIDGGAGFQQATTNFPSDSHHNFRLMAGIGGTLRLADRLRLMGGARYMHISNASTSDRNDGGDWAQLYLGAMLTF